MATKNNPGKYDCYENAEPDEPMFILLARDKHAPALVDMWAELREAEREHSEKVEEARICARNMRKYRDDKLQERTCQDGGPLTLKEAVFEIIRRLFWDKL